MSNSNRNKEDKHGRAQEPQRAPQPAATSSLLQRLLRKFSAAGETQSAADQAKPLEPAGRRSGKGAESVTPYLDEVRNSRPGPLE